MRLKPSLNPLSLSLSLSSIHFHRLIFQFPFPSPVLSVPVSRRMNALVSPVAFLQLLCSIIPQLPLPLSSAAIALISISPMLYDIMSWNIACMPAWVYVCMHACLYLCVYACMHVPIYVCMHAYSPTRFIYVILRRHISNIQVWACLSLNLDQ